MTATIQFCQHRTFTSAQWAALCLLTQDLIAAGGQVLSDASGRPGSVPLITSDVISFNAPRPHGYESFRLARTPPARSSATLLQPAAQWVKTRGLPYGTIISAVLQAADLVAPGVLSFPGINGAHFSAGADLLRRQVNDYGRPEPGSLLFPGRPLFPERT